MYCYTVNNTLDDMNVFLNSIFDYCKDFYHSLRKICIKLYFRSCNLYIIFQYYAVAISSATVRQRVTGINGGSRTFFIRGQSD